MDTKLTGKTRIESDLIGAREIPAEALYGVQTLRGIENFSISKFRLSEYPLFIKGLAITKMAAAMANFELGLLTVEQKDAIIAACGEILDGKHHDQFTWSFGEQYWYSPRSCPISSKARLAITSFAFIFVVVPAPPWIISTGNWS